jgi:hypothetical protein
MEGLFPEADMGSPSLARRRQTALQPALLSHLLWNSETHVTLRYSVRGFAGRAVGYTTCHPDKQHPADTKHMGKLKASAQGSFVGRRFPQAFACRNGGSITTDEHALATAKALKSANEIGP